MNAPFAVTEDYAQAWVRENIKEIDVLVCGTGFNTAVEMSVMDECQRHGIRTVAILDYWSNYKKRFSYEGRFLCPDDLIVMDTIARDEAIAEGIVPQIIRVLGHPGLDEVLQKRTGDLSVWTPETCKNVLLLGEPLNNPSALGYTEEQFFEDCIDVLTGLGKRVLVKFHPRDEEVLKKKYSDYSVDGDLLDIASRQDMVIGMNTIALLHCALLGKIAISYQPGLAREDVSIADKLGLSRLIVSREELSEFLIQPFVKSQAVRNDLIWLDGKSTERVARFLEELK